MTIWSVILDKYDKWTSAQLEHILGARQLYIHLTSSFLYGGCFITSSASDLEPMGFSIPTPIIHSLSSMIYDNLILARFMNTNGDLKARDKLVYIKKS